MLQANLFHYSVYGLHLASNIALPDLMVPLTQEKLASIDLQLWLGCHAPLEAAEPEIECYASPYLDDNAEPVLRVLRRPDASYYKYQYSDGVEIFLKGDGTAIWAKWPPETALEYVTIRVLGPVLGFVLSLRGVTSLHASGVIIDGQVVVFVGESGAGKSTTAATFAKAGYSILTDDVVTLEEQADRFLVQPGYAYIRLWPEAVAGLYGSPEGLPRLVPTHPVWDKRYLDLRQPGYEFGRQVMPLAAIYLLERVESEPELEPVFENLPGQLALMALVYNIFTNYLSTKAMQARQFQLMGRLVKQVPLRKLTYGGDLSKLNQLCQAIVADFSTIKHSSEKDATY